MSMKLSVLASGRSVPPAKIPGIMYKLFLDIVYLVEFFKHSVSETRSVSFIMCKRHLISSGKSSFQDVVFEKFNTMDSVQNDKGKS
jgi:hypothetical protein